ncbi:hypothetical protein EVAR_66663_1 [Eumeta japonica]|uniref:Uncharacterized protein n=1 Tax=Eumeta variegata TaxID=151549 RepID=A0A4C1ZCA6_EUMVA|nr:hypothetical protein EVAR_66663_1 [Eumeta japonica]
MKRVRYGPAGGKLEITIRGGGRPSLCRLKRSDKLRQDRIGVDNFDRKGDVREVLTEAVGHAFRLAELPTMSHVNPRVPNTTSNTSTTGCCKQGQGVTCVKIGIVNNNTLIEPITAPGPCKNGNDLLPYRSGGAGDVAGRAGPLAAGRNRRTVLFQCRNQLDSDRRCFNNSALHAVGTRVDVEVHRPRYENIAVFVDISHDLEAVVIYQVTTTSKVFGGSLSFDHHSHDWEAFKVRLTQFCVANGVTDENDKNQRRRRAFLITALTEDNASGVKSGST